jgi:proteasome activator subunit 4
MSVDGEVREATPVDRTLVGPYLTKHVGFTAGSRAVDSLDRMITSIESFFHPTNTGPWTLSVRFNVSISHDVLIWINS